MMSDELKTNFLSVLAPLHEVFLFNENLTQRRKDAKKREARRSEEHTSELQSPCNLVCRLLLEKTNACRRRVTGARRHVLRADLHRRRVLWFDQPAPDCVARELHPVVYPELIDAVRPVSLHAHL